MDEIPMVRPGRIILRAVGGIALASALLAFGHLPADAPQTKSPGDEGEISSIDFASVSPESDRRANTAAYLSRVYDISYDYSSTIVDEAWHQAARNNLSPMLVLAVIMTESSFQANAESPAGAVGLMQVRPTVHAPLVRNIAKTKGLDNRSLKTVLLDPSANIEAGTKVLKMYQDMSNGDMEEALLRYNGSYYQHDYKYARKVMKNMDRLVLAQI